MTNLKLKLIVPALAAIFIITSCETNEVAPNDVVLNQELTQSASSGATVYKSKEIIDFGEAQDWYFGTACGEYRIVEGVQQINFLVVENVNKLTVHFHLNNSNFRVIHEATGEIYTGNNTINLTEHITKPGDFPYSYKESFRAVLTTPGKDNNILLKSDYVLRIDADGSVRVEEENISIDCEK